jgi:trafficking protein particle complex subunit 3
MYLNIQPTISNWGASSDEFSLTFDNNPLSEFVELPPDMSALRYSGIMCGAVRGALEMVQLEVQCWFVQVRNEYLRIPVLDYAIYIFFFRVQIKDQLKGDGVTELRVKFIRRLEDAIPAGED